MADLIQIPLGSDPGADRAPSEPALRGAGGVLLSAFVCFYWVAGSLITALLPPISVRFLELVFQIRPVREPVPRLGDYHWILSAVVLFGSYLAVTGYVVADDAALSTEFICHMALIATVPNACVWIYAGVLAVKEGVRTLRRAKRRRAKRLEVDEDGGIALEAL